MRFKSDVGSSPPPFKRVVIRTPALGRLEKQMKRKIVICLIILISMLELFAQDDDEFGYRSFKPDSVVVTSTLIEKSKSEDYYGYKNLYDSTWKSWVEGESGDGIQSGSLSQPVRPEPPQPRLIKCS